MNDYRINLNYAKALLMLSIDLGDSAQVMEDMRLVNKVFKENRQLDVVFKNPVIHEEKKLAVVRELFEERVSKTTMAFLLFVTKKRRAVNLRGISQMYKDLYREANNIVVADVMTAVEVNEEHLENIRQKVAAYTKKDVEIYSHTTNKMLGSFHLMFDTYLYDARIRTKIAKMRVAFSKNDYEGRL